MQVTNATVLLSLNFHIWQTWNQRKEKTDGVAELLLAGVAGWCRHRPRSPQVNVVLVVLVAIVMMGPPPSGGGGGGEEEWRRTYIRYDTVPSSGGVFLERGFEGRGGGGGGGVFGAAGVVPGATWRADGVDDASGGGGASAGRKTSFSSTRTASYKKKRLCRATFYLSSGFSQPDFFSLCIVVLRFIATETSRNV